MVDSIDGLIEALRIVYFADEEERDHLTRHKDDLFGLACQSLEQHRLADFPLENEMYFS